MNLELLGFRLVVEIGGEQMQCKQNFWKFEHLRQILGQVVSKYVKLA